MSIWLRVSRFIVGESALTTVSSKDDLRQDIHVIANETRVKFARTVDVEIFEHDGDLESASLEAARRAQVRISREKHLRDTLHDFLVAMFIAQKPSTIIMPAHQAPVSSGDMRQILLDVMQHPAYSGHTVLLQSTDGNRVSLEKGTVIVREPA